MRQSLRFALGLAMLLGGCGEPVAQSTPTIAPTIAPAATATTAPTIAPTIAPAATATIAPAGGAAGDAPPAGDTLPGDAELPAPPNSEPYAQGADAPSDAAIAEHGALPATLLGSQNVTQSAIAVYRSKDSLADLRTFYGEAIKGANWLGYRTETSNDKLLLGYQYGGRGPYDIAQVVALPDPATQGETSLVIITIGTAE